MYIKKEKRANNRLYLSIIHGYRDENNKVKHKTIKTFGYLDELEKEHDNPLAYIEAELKKISENDITELTIKNINKKNISFTEDNDECDEKNIGYFLLKKIYNELGITDFLKEKQKNLKIDYDLNQVLLLLVLSRILYPGSKKNTYESRNKFFEKFDFSLKDLYRSLDLFDQYKEDIQNIMWKNTKDKYDRDLSIGYFDCTNYYFEIDNNDEDLVDEEGKILEKGYRKRGPEKNHRPDPIVEMGLLIDSKTIPVSYEIFPGNESEKLHLRPIVNRTKRNNNREKIIIVADRGLNTSDNMYFLAGKNDNRTKNFDGYVYGQSVRGANKEFKEWVLDQEGYSNDVIYTSDGKEEQFRQRIYNNNGEFSHYEKRPVIFKHKSRVVAKTIQIERDGKRKNKVTTYQKQMAYFSQRYADKQKYEREKMVEKAKDLISNPKKYTRATSYGAAAYVNNIAYDKETGEVKDKLDLSLNTKQIEEEEKYDGYYSIVTSELEMSDTEMRKVYKGLAQIEHTFRITKSNLEARPVYVWIKEHIEAHFLTCFISMVILRLIECKLEGKYPIENIINALRNTTAVHLEHDVYHQKNVSKIINDLSDVFNLDLYIKNRNLQNIKKILKN